jgi:hypothetical protein
MLNAPVKATLISRSHAWCRVFAGQADVEANINEIPMFAVLLDRLDRARAVVAADALHASALTPSTWPDSAARTT